MTSVIKRRELPPDAVVTSGFLSAGITTEKSLERSSISKSPDPSTWRTGRLKSHIPDVEEGQWLAKTKERQLIREKGTLLKKTRELQHSTNLFNKAKIEEGKEHFQELQSKLNILSKLHSGSYQLSKRNTLDRIDGNRKRLQLVREEGRKSEMLLTTTEQRYQSILNAMDQIMVEAEELGLQFEKKLRDKARRHHQMGNELKEVGAQLRLERAKKEKFIKEEERHKRDEAVGKLSQWRASEIVDSQLKNQLQSYEKQFLDQTRKLGRNLRDMDHSVKLQQREYGRKLQDVNCLLAAVDEEQKKLCENKLHLENQEEIEENDQSVQEHLTRQKAHQAQKQTKANKWEPKLRQLAKENETRLNKMEKKVLYDDVVKAGSKEQILYRKMRSLESETRKQEQIFSSKKAVMEAANNIARKEAIEQLKQNDNHQKVMIEEVAKEEATLRQLVVQRDNALTEYRQHQAGLKDIIQLFQTLSSEQERKNKLAESN